MFINKTYQLQISRSQCVFDICYGPHCEKSTFENWLANIPHILGLVPNRKSRLGTNFYQLLVVEICRNTCKSCDKMLQLLQNHSISHHTDSQHSLISFLWFRVICGSIAMLDSSDRTIWMKFWKYFYFSSLELKSTKTTKPYRLKHDC